MSEISKSPAAGKERSYWLKTMLHWHWISSALCLIGMLLFSITGITLNHAGQIEASPKVSTRTVELPASLQKLIAPGDADADESADKKGRALPGELQRWVTRELRVDLSGREPEWSPEEIYIPLPRPGGDAWLRIDRAAGELEYELTDRGWISYLNDLHKGRNTGTAWSWFIDIFSIACLVFCITGLVILKLYAGNRPITWPLVAAGLVIPVLLAIVFIH